MQEALKAKLCGNFTRETYGSLRYSSALLCKKFTAETLLTAVKKWSIPLRISSVNVTISAVSCVLKKSLMDNFIFCAVSLIDVLNLEHGTITIWNIGQSWSISNCEKTSLVAVLLLSFLLDTVREIFFYITQGM